MKRSLAPFFAISLAISLTLGTNAAYSSDHGTASTAATPSTPSTPTITGMDALKTIQDGNKRFAEGKPRHLKADPESREQLAQGQKPPTIVLSCSDSRVPPEVIFDQGLGEVFTVRSAGHALNAETIASIEYAVEHLDSRLLLVMGHESCGAIKAAITTPVGKSAGSVHLDRLLAGVRPNIAEGHMNSQADPTFHLAAKDHVAAVTRSLVKRSRIIRENVHAGKLIVAEGLYGLKTGKVEFWAVGEKFN